MNKIKNSGSRSRLTKRQKKFIEFYLQTDNGSESARKAGYTVKRGEHKDEMAMNIGIGEGKTQAEIVNLKVQSKDRLKAAEMLAKIRGLFVNKSELEVSGNIPIVIKDDI